MKLNPRGPIPSFPSTFGAKYEAMFSPQSIEENFISTPAHARGLPAPLGPHIKHRSNAQGGRCVWPRPFNNMTACHAGGGQGACSPQGSLIQEAGPSSLTCAPPPCH